MAKVALVWELGGDLGHLARFPALIEALRAAGHEPVLVLKELQRAESILGPLNVEYLQAPIWLMSAPNLPPPVNFTETLLQFGLLDPQALIGMLKAWRALFAYLRADAYVLDHAPTASLALRGSGLPQIGLGNSFTVLPIMTPLPPYDRTARVDPARLAASEALLVRNANSALAKLDAPAIERVCDIYVEQVLHLCTTPDLDVYGARDPAVYGGPLGGVEHGGEPQWPSVGERRIFAYLKPEHVQFEVTLAALARSGASVIVFAPGIAPERLQRAQAANMAVTDRPLRMSRVSAECDLGICHAGVGTAGQLLSAGKPVLLLPMQMEQLMLSRRVLDNGCGLMWVPGMAATEVGKQIKRLLGEPGFSVAAQAYALRNAAYNQDACIAGFMRKLTKMLSAA